MLPIGVTSAVLAKLRLVLASAAMLFSAETAVGADVMGRPPAVVEANWTSTLRTQEDAYDQIYRIGCAPDKLYLDGGWNEREKTWFARGRDQRTGIGNIPTANKWPSLAPIWGNFGAM